MKVKTESEAAQSCLTLSDPMDCNLPGTYVHGIFQARVLEWVPLPSLSDFTRMIISGCIYVATNGITLFIFVAE